MVWRGGNCVKSVLKQEKSSVRPFTLQSSFYMSRGGESEAPIRRMAHWGLLENLHGTSFKNFNFNPHVCFLRLLLRGLYGPSYVSSFKAGLKLQQFNRNKIRWFFPPVSKAAKHSGWFVKRWAGEIEGEVVSPSKTILRLPIGETFSREVTATRGAWNVALTGGFNHRFLNNHFTL